MLVFSIALVISFVRGVCIFPCLFMMFSSSSLVIRASLSSSVRSSNANRL